jgi:hypothetical protein
MESKITKIGEMQELQYFISHRKTMIISKFATYPNSDYICGGKHLLFIDFNFASRNIPLSDGISTAKQVIDCIYYKRGPPKKSILARNVLGRGYWGQIVVVVVDGNVDVVAVDVVVTI